MTPDHHSSMAGGYTAADEERYLAEPTQPHRTAFARDRARIVHSASLRRLAAKTQVVGPSSDDFIRNRLTHTLEVAQVGRDLAAALGTDPDIVEAACLAHDLGHPPFGHNGETALNIAATAIGGFEGNAQTLRLLTWLEAKSVDPLTLESRGLNLTRAVLDASTKYPWTIGDAPAPGGRHLDGVPRAARKFGVYAEQLPVFDWMRKGAPIRTTPIEAQIMDFADDVAYSVHDIEDAIVGRRISPATLDDSGLRRDIWSTVQTWYASDRERDELEAAYRRLSALASWPSADYNGERRQLAGLKTMTSNLINRFCFAVGLESFDEAARAPLTRYAGRLRIPDEVSAEILALKGIAAHLVMKADERVAEHDIQRTILLELVDALVDAPETAFEPTFRADLAAARDDDHRLRVVVDQVASFTDVSAVDRHRALTRTS